MKITLQQTGQWLAADIQTPISLFLGLVGKSQGFLLESAEVDGRRGRYSVIGFNLLLRLGCKNGKLEVASRDSRLNKLKEFEGMDFIEGARKVMEAIHIEPQGDMKELPAIARGLFGYFGYTTIGMFEKKLEEVLPPENSDACLMLPGTIVLFDHLYNKLCMLNLADNLPVKMDRAAVERTPEAPNVGEITTIPDKASYLRNVQKVQEQLRQGEAIQVVVSTRFQASFEGDPFILYRRLRQINPSPYMFFMRLSHITLIGSSPETMVRCQDNTVEVCPIAGTRPRGATDAEDAALAEDLLADPKERAEHVMLVDLGRNDVGRIAEAGTVSVEKFMQVERFSHVMHMTSYVKAQLKKGYDALDVLGATFPAGTVSGAPKIRAIEIIEETEAVARGAYAGTIGWLGLDKDSVNLDTGILIRTMWVKDNTVQWQCGAGIVHDSVPEKEWEECHNKARVLKVTLKATGQADVFAGR